MSDATPGAGLDATLRGFRSGQKVFNRYTMIRTLGRGGMGIVWLAHDDQLEREVALKFVPELIVLDPAVLNDLKRETKRSLELTHKNIVRIYDFVHDNDSACISMEYIDGGTLSGLRVQKEQEIFEPDKIADWIGQLSDALDYAHNHARIVHRDLKPSNLMVNERGDLKIADFGIARSLSDSVSMLTHARGTSGTLVYMSPQQLDGERGTHLDDIYSLGATIYDLLTSRPPFYSGNIDRQIREKIPPPMAQRRRDLEIEGSPIPKNWEETVAACLSKDPAKRPQSATELARRLGLSLSGRAPAPGQKLQRSLRKIPPLISQLWEDIEARAEQTKPVLIAAVLICAALLAFIFLRHPTTQKITESTRSPAPVPAITASPAVTSPPASELLAPDRLLKEATALRDRGDYSKAAELYQKAAEQGDPTAQANLGWLYDQGKGVAQNYSKAAEFYQKASEQGNKTAQYNLGILYEQGKGVSQNYSKAAELYQRASDQADPDARYSLGILYEHGKGVARDYSKATELYRKAADQGNGQARENLRRLEQAASKQQPTRYGPTLLMIGTGYRIKDDHRGNSIARLSAEHYGFVDETGRLVIEPQWEEAFPFSEGLAAVKQNGKYGFIDKSGRVVIDPQWDTAWHFSEGFARVMRGGTPGYGAGGKWGFIDKTGRVVSEPQWDLVWDFSEGFAAVKQGSKWGFIDNTGRVVIEPQYDSAYGFSEDLAGVELHDKRKWVFIDKTGRTILEPGGLFFSEGLAEIGDAFRQRFMDKSGRMVIERLGQQAFPFSEGLAAVKENNKFGFIDKSGHIVIEPQWDGYKFSFSGGLAAVKRNWKFGLIDKSGRVVIEPEWDFIDRYQEAKEMPSHWLIARQDRDKVHVEWLDAAGRQIWSRDTLSTSYASPAASPTPVELPRAKNASPVKLGRQSQTRPLLRVWFKTLSEYPGAHNVPPLRAIDQGVLVFSIGLHGTELKGVLRPWDVITKVDGAPVTTSTQFWQAIETKKLEQDVELMVWRDDQMTKVGITPGELGLAKARDAELKGDSERAIQLTKEAADQGHPEAQVALGDLYFEGKMVKQDYTQAAELYQKAADHNDPVGQYSLGVFYEQGKGVPQNLTTAIDLYKKAAQQGDAEAKKRLERIEAERQSTTPNNAKGQQEVADQSDPAAQYNLAFRYMMGAGVPKDVHKAVELYQKSADGGNLYAQYRLAMMLEDGEGMQQDMRKAAEYYQKSADQGFRAAESRLGDLYATGDGVPKNLGKAADLYQKAADQGNPDAQCNLGTFYENGTGVAKDIAKAADLFRKSAAQGNATAKLNLERLSAAPNPLTQNGRTAQAWVGDFVRQFVGANQSPDPGLTLAYYGTSVDYFDEKKKDQAYIRQDIEKYNQRWPIRHDEIEGDVHVQEKVPGQQYSANFKLNFYAESVPRNIWTKGLFAVDLDIAIVDGNPKITSIREKTLQQQKGRPGISPKPRTHR